MLFIAVVLCFLSKSAWSSQDKTFPPGFKFGAASSAYQVEGGWNADDKSESIWDALTHRHPEIIANNNNGDVACDSYNQWERDIEMITELGLDFYRFSISWPRLLPTGFPNNISEAGTKYYNNLINGLLAKGVEPVITIYHWDLPEKLQQLGGWTNPLTADWFADYARVAYTLFGDRVKTWVTINEPLLICDGTYNTGSMAPSILDSSGVAVFICSKNVLIAHAKAYKIYDEDFRAKYKGEVGITNQLLWAEAESDEDEELAEMLRELSGGLYSHPIYSKEGGWPPSIEKYIAEKSRKEGYPRSRLPAFTKEEKEFVRGSYDFYGFNHYTSRMVRKAKSGEILKSWPMNDCPEFDAKMSVKSEWPVSGCSWFAVYPEGIRYMLAWIKKRYGDVKILITENGYSDTNETLDDVRRIQYYKDYLQQVLLAIKEDGVNVVGYTAWTLMDNFEWVEGYRSETWSTFSYQAQGYAACYRNYARNFFTSSAWFGESAGVVGIEQAIYVGGSVNFGLYAVDFNDPARTRTARASARYYASVIQCRCLNVSSHHISDEL